MNRQGLVVLLRRFCEGELRGVIGGGGFYVNRKPGESEEKLRDRAAAEAEKLGGFVVIAEDRVGASLDQFSSRVDASRSVWASR
jgi:hypothetical protein